MADSYIQYPTDGSGKKQASKTRTQGADTVHDQTALVTDGSGNVLGVSATPVRTDPTGTTAQPVTDNSGSLTVDAPVGTPAFVRLSDGSAAWVGQKASAASLPVVVASDQSAVPVSGTVTASGPITDAQFTAQKPFPVTDNSGSLTVDSPGLPVALDGTSLKVKEQSPLTQPLTDTQLAARLPLSVEQATSVDVVPPSQTTNTGTITAAAQTVVLAVPAGGASWGFRASGTWTGSVLQFEGSTDGGTNYAGVMMTVLGAMASATQSHGTSITGIASVTFQAVGPCAGLTHVRVRCSSYTTADSVSVNLSCSQGFQPTSGLTLPGVATPADTVANANLIAGTVASVPMGFNGTTWDRVRSTLATSTVTNVAASASSVQLLASTVGRRGCIIQNDGTSNMYLKLGTTATATTSFTVKLAPGGVYELPQPVYTGRIDAIWTATGGNGAAITELT